MDNVFRGERIAVIRLQACRSHWSTVKCWSVLKEAKAVVNEVGYEISGVLECFGIDFSVRAASRRVSESRASKGCEISPRSASTSLGRSSPVEISRERRN